MTTLALLSDTVIFHKRYTIELIRTIEGPLYQPHAAIGDVFIVVYIWSMTTYDRFHVPLHIHSHRVEYTWLVKKAGGNVSHMRSLYSV